MNIEQLVEDYEKREYSGWMGARHPLDYIRETVQGQFMLVNPKIKEVDFNHPKMRSLVNLVSATSLMAGEKEEQEVIGNAFATAVIRGQSAGKQLAGGVPIEEVIEGLAVWCGVEI